ncbi:MAG: hypothetical protein J5724_01870 [Ruminococcus sp.]|uniref:hypothetical protein n=1 Tax=Ruminococcus sp. TaxID=41978 RepID=UPI001B00DB96|nr:hypothetical protein [Ruminococcus sp.]MBO4493111.1 hypothetical protein [Ruminococcus sp.]MBO7474446.1 hypothetical protein [Ruminococcus sp.]
MKQISAPENTSGSKNTALKGAAETTSALRRLYIREGKTAQHSRSSVLPPSRADLPGYRLRRQPGKRPEAA